MALGDGDDRKRRALLVLQHQPFGPGRDVGGRQGERDRERPRGSVGQLSPRADGGHVGDREVARQRREHPGGEQFELAHI